MSNPGAAAPLGVKLAAVCPPFFKALCEPSRLDLLAGLVTTGRPCTVSEIAAHLPLDLSVGSRHLSLMRDAGILRADKRGRDVYYSVQVGTIARTLRSVADMLEAASPGTPGATP